MTHVFPINPQYAEHTLTDNQKYMDMYSQSVTNNEDFWAEHGKRLDWFTPYTKIKNVSFAKDDLHIRWYEDGTLNVSYNCIDRHLAKHANDTAIIWEGDNPNNTKKITFQELHDEVCKFSNVLKELGIKKGDRVTLYMPMILESAYAMLACSRIGAIHSVVFGGFSPEALAGRIIDCKSNIVITADASNRGGKQIPLKANVDAAAKKPGVLDYLEKVLVIKNTGMQLDWNDDLDHWYEPLHALASTSCEPEVMNAEDPLFILYTSGSTGTPKGVLHTTGGYLVFASMTHEYVFDYKPGDIYWCTADVGWITGHSYIVYGPLANAATTLMFEGVPSYPDFSRFWQICDKHQVNIFYTAPTAIRALMRQGDEPVKATSRSSLRLLGTVGEPINPEAWEWYHKVIGNEHCPIVDTWWQTETGGCMLTPLPGATELKPGSATRPFFGVQPALVDDQGTVLEGEAEGNLIITDSWPGQMRSVYGDHKRFVDTYFSQFPGNYFTGDGARRDEDGYYWITGRVDDVLNVSGHRLGTAEIESALVAHPSVAEAAVVGCPHDIKGQGIYAYVTVMNKVTENDELLHELKQWVRKEIGPIATPEFIQWAPILPKTRSGKIMRRILRKIAANDQDHLGDVSTLANSEVVTELIAGRLNK